MAVFVADSLGDTSNKAEGGRRPDRSANHVIFGVIFATSLAEVNRNTEINILEDISLNCRGNRLNREAISLQPDNRSLPLGPGHTKPHTRPLPVHP